MSYSFDDGSLVPARPSDAPQRATPSPRGAADGDAGVSSNTPPSNHHESGISAGGEDWVEEALYCEHQEFGDLTKRLDAAKVAAEAGEQCHEWTLGGVKFRCLTGTARAGRKGKQVAYRWRLESECGLVLLLMNRPDPHPTLPNGIARATSLPLLRHGTLGCQRHLQNALKALGIDVVRSKLTRVDPCADLPGLAVTPFYQAYSDGRYVTRARKAVDFVSETEACGYRLGRNGTGLRLGGHDLKLRVYDKFRELLREPEKCELMLQRRYGEPITTATRAEFEFHRACLKELGVNTLDDWIEKRGKILEYATHEWVRFTADKFDPRHPERAATLPEWTRVQERFAEWCGPPGDVQLAPLAKCRPNVEHLKKQCIGLLNTILVHERRPIDSNDSFVQEALYTLVEVCEDRDMAAEHRQRAFELRVPYSDFGIQNIENSADHEEGANGNPS